jgi:hypothetical protein
MGREKERGGTSSSCFTILLLHATLFDVIPPFLGYVAPDAHIPPDQADSREEGQEGGRK